MILDLVKKQLGSIPSFKRVVVGVSGGADSVALAHVLMRLGYSVTIAHLDHGLRGKESDGDAEFVKGLAKQWKIPIVTYKINIPKKGNLENAARELRYEFLEKVRRAVKARYIAVAHHLDDHIETILLHIERGAGSRGLCGMSIVTNNIIRPLLMLHKKDVTDYLKSEKLTFRTDSSNFDLKLKRNYFRHVVIPKLKKNCGDIETKLLHLSDYAKDRIKKVEIKAKKWINKHVKNSGFERSAFLSLSDEVQSEILFMLIGYNDVYSSNIQELKGLIAKGASGKHKKIRNIIVRSQYGKIIFDEIKCPSPDMPKVRLTKREVVWGGWKLKYLGNSIIYARQWKPGDRFEPLGMKGEKKLQDFFTDKKIPQTERRSIPIIVDKDDKVLSVSDLRVTKNAQELKKDLFIHKIHHDQSRHDY